MKKRMKFRKDFLLLLFFFASALSAAFAQDALVTLNFNKVSLGDVLNEIGKQTSLSIVYNTKDVKAEAIVSVKATGEKLSSVMARLLKGKNTSYSIRDQFLVLHTESNVGSVSPDSQKNRIVKGVVKDDKGESLFGVSIVLKGTTKGCLTDLNGNYSVAVPSSDAILEFNYLGFRKQSIIVGNKTVLNVIMGEDSKALKEVVVTALGIERESKSLTYATQQLGGRELTRNKEVNFINSLQGKSAGLTITPNTSSGAGGGASKIVLRGQSSILGNNQPLIVIDGIPISNGLSGQTSEVIMGSARDGGDILSTMNPDDIANVSILKGPNAAALYGSAANNGVIIITTKAGQEGKVRVDVSSNVTFEAPLVYPRQQTVFAPEIDGSTVRYNGWGGKIADLTDDQLAMFPYLTRNPRNNVLDFFRTGETYNNSFSLSGGTENSTTYFSYGNTHQKGLIQNNDFMRHNFMLKEGFNMFNKRLKIDLSLNYITQKVKNRPVIGLSKGSMPGLYRTPSAVDLRYFDANRSHLATADDPIVMGSNTGGKVYNSHLIGKPVQSFAWLNESWINNPYYMLDAIEDIAGTDRILGSVTAKVDILKGLTGQARASIDKTVDDNRKRENASIYGANYQSIAGNYWVSNNKRQEIYSDYLLTYTKNLKEISINTTVGASFKRSQSEGSWMSKFNDSTYYEPNISIPMGGGNGSFDPNARPGSVLDGDATHFSTNWEAAVFATVQIGLWEKGYIDASFRNDWAKAFQQFAPKGQYKSFPYYSVGGNVLLHELFPFKMKKVDQLKARASYSMVGNSVPSRYYAVQSISPLGGGYSTQAPRFENPKPETTKSVEFGIDGELFRNSLTFDLTYYNSVMENQFLEYQTPAGQMKPANSGKIRNRGVEFSTRYNHRISQNWRWITGLNMAYNESKILQTFNLNGNPLDITSIAASLSIVSKFAEGGAYGDLYAKDYERDVDGKIKIVNGNPKIADQNNRYLGNTAPKITLGWNNTFLYKDFSLYFLIDGKIGGKVISYTESVFDKYGLSTRSADARMSGITMEDENGQTVSAVILPDGQRVPTKNYYETIGGNQFDCAYDATNLRLREVSFGYTFADLFGQTKNLTLSLVARNVCFLYKNSPVDPDVSVTAANTFGGVDAFSLPSTRSFGLNLKVTF